MDAVSNWKFLFQDPLQGGTKFLKEVAGVAESEGKSFIKIVAALKLKAQQLEIIGVNRDLFVRIFDIRLC